MPMSCNVRREHPNEHWHTKKYQLFNEAFFFDFFMAKKLNTKRRFTKTMFYLVVTKRENIPCEKSTELI